MDYHGILCQFRHINYIYKKRTKQFDQWSVICIIYNLFICTKKERKIFHKWIHKNTCVPCTFDREKQDQRGSEFTTTIAAIFEFFGPRRGRLLPTQKKSEAFRLLGSCSRLSVSDVRSWELGVFALFGVGVPVGVAAPRGVLLPEALCEGDGV